MNAPGNQSAPPLWRPLKAPSLAEFEVEHRRILAMQTLYYKKRKAGGVA